jgi:hypothetical protein
MVYGVFLAAQPKEQLADIREFFPGGAAATNHLICDEPQPVSKVTVSRSPGP